jgi:hypothetical protein
MAIWKICICASLLAALVGCTTVYQIPPSLTPEQRAELQPSPFSQFVIGIETEPDVNGTRSFPEYVINDFKTLFTKSGLFKEVAFTKSLSTQPDVIVQLHSGPSPVMCATGEASLMIMTLGMVPLSGSDNIKYSFAITNPKKVTSLELEFTFIRKSDFGSISTMMSMSSNWATTPQVEKNYELFAYELTRKKKEILEIAAGRD